MCLYPIIWSPKAKISYCQILEYIETNWSFTELTKFANRTKQVLDYINKNPLLYPYSKESDTFRCVIVAQTILFYRIKNEQIELLLFWDMHQNPLNISY